MAPPNFQPWDPTDALPQRIPNYYNDQIPHCTPLTRTTTSAGIACFLNSLVRYLHRDDEILGDHDAVSADPADRAKVDRRRCAYQLVDSCQNLLVMLKQQDIDKKQEDTIPILTKLYSPGNRTELPPSNSYKLLELGSDNASQTLDFLDRVMQLAEDKRLTEQSCISLIMRHTKDKVADCVRLAQDDGQNLEHIVRQIEINFANLKPPTVAEEICRAMVKEKDESYSNFLIRVRSMAKMACRTRPNPKEEALALSKAVLIQRLPAPLYESLRQKELTRLQGGVPKLTIDQYAAELDFLTQQARLLRTNMQRQGQSNPYNNPHHQMPNIKQEPASIMHVQSLPESSSDPFESQFRQMALEDQDDGGQTVAVYNVRPSTRDQRPRSRERERGRRGTPSPRRGSVPPRYSRRADSPHPSKRVYYSDRGRQQNDRNRSYSRDRYRSSSRDSRYGGRDRDRPRRYSGSYDQYRDRNQDRDRNRYRPRSQSNDDRYSDRGSRPTMNRFQLAEKYGVDSDSCLKCNSPTHSYQSQQCPYAGWNLTLTRCEKCGRGGHNIQNCLSHRENASKN